MKKPIAFLALALALAFPARAQNLTANTVQTQTLIFPASDAVSQVSTVTVAPSVYGTTSYYYWIVSRTASAVSVPAGPFIGQAPASLSSVQNILITWKPVSGIVSYDVLRTSSSTPPSGACGCAVTLAATLTSLTDSGAALQAYTVSAVGQIWTLINQQNAGVQAVMGQYGGVLYQLLPPPVPPSSIVTYQAPVTAGDLPEFLNTAGVLSDSNIPANTVSTYTGTITPGDTAVFNNSSGKLQDGGLPPPAVSPTRNTLCMNNVPVQVSNTTTETTFMSCVIPANTLTTAGTVIHIRAFGTNGNSSAANANYEYRVYLDGNKIVDDGDNAVTGDKGTAWAGQADLILGSVGPGGVVEADGELWITLNNAGSTATPQTTIDNGTFAFDTTAAHTIKVTIQLGTAATTVAPTMRAFFVEMDLPGSGVASGGLATTNLSSSNGTAVSAGPLTPNGSMWGLFIIGTGSTSYTGATVSGSWTNMSTVGAANEVWQLAGISSAITASGTLGSAPSDGWNTFLGLFPTSGTPSLIGTTAITSTNFPGTVNIESGYTPAAGDTLFVIAKIANAGSPPTAVSVADPVNGQWQLIGACKNTAASPSALYVFAVTNVPHTSITVTISIGGGNSGSGYNANYAFMEMSNIKAIP